VARAHTDWFLNALRSMETQTRESVIHSVFFFVDKSQHRLKPQYADLESSDALKAVRAQHAFEGLTMNELFDRKDPTVENVRLVIERLVECGISEPFLVTSLYDQITLVLESAADSHERARGDDNLRKRLDTARQHPAVLFGMDDVEEAEQFIAFIEGTLAESATRLARSKDVLADWREVTKDREHQVRYLGCWGDLLDRDLGR